MFIEEKALFPIIYHSVEFKITINDFNYASLTSSVVEISFSTLKELSWVMTEKNETVHVIKSISI